MYFYLCQHRLPFWKMFFASLHFRRHRRYAEVQKTQETASISIKRGVLSKYFCLVLFTAALMINYIN